MLIDGLISEKALRLVTAEADSEEVRRWVLSTLKEVRKQFPHCDFYVLKRKRHSEESPRIYIGIGVRLPTKKSGENALVLLAKNNAAYLGFQHNGQFQAKYGTQISHERMSSVQNLDMGEVRQWLEELDHLLDDEDRKKLQGDARTVDDYLLAPTTAPLNGLGSQTSKNVTAKPSLNQILFGPPGTGKTYATINAALEILDPVYLHEQLNNRSALKQRFDELVELDRIRFVTFHQSFSYEDFVEGIRATTDEVSQQLRYEVVDGVFKSLCEAAASKVTQLTEAPTELGQRRIWKMSLGNTQGEDACIYEQCLAGGYVLLGYGGGIDFSGCTNREQVQARFAKAGVTPEKPAVDYGITSVTALVTRMQEGDLIVVSDGNFKFRAIGEVTGSYQFKPHAEFESDYSQMRPVKWLRQYQPSLPHNELLNAQFSQMTLYELRAPTLNREKFQSLLDATAAAGEDKSSTDARVLIIDEINRGNISRIFGELITLIEPSKRAGADEALSVMLPYSKQRFSVPDNLYLIGTMNTADRSLAGLDIALRRRFVFREMPPQPELLDDVWVAELNIGQLLRVMNQRIEVLLDRDHCLGHAYFMPLINDPTLEHLEVIFRNQILPLLQEYFFEDWQRIHWVLNDQRKTRLNQFVQKVGNSVEALFGQEVAQGLERNTWTLNDEAFERLEAYLGIVDHHALDKDPVVKQEASHGDIVLRELKSGSIEVLLSGIRQSPSKPVLRELAKELGVNLHCGNGTTLNTRALGRQLIKQLCSDNE